MLVVARRTLAEPWLARGTASSTGLMLLVEGSWSEDEAGGSSPPWCRRHALDTAIDGRYAHLDVDALRIAGEIIAAAAPDDPAEPNFAELNALRLRYAVVKWLRPIAWWRARFADGPCGPVRLAVESPRDTEYEILFRQLAEADGFPLNIESPAGRSTAPPIGLPPNPFWRRLAGRVLAGRPPARHSSAPRVLLSGNPRILDPICAELVDRGVTVAWLYDRFSFGCRRRWHRRGVAQFVCDSSFGRFDRFPPRLCNEPLVYQGVDLAPVANAWYDELRRSLAPSQDRLWSQIGGHVDNFRPTHTVVDEDATPQARAAIHHGRRVGATSAVVQHGICGVQFGFAPLLADSFCAWDDGSRRQLEAWGVAPQAVAVTGSPYQEQVAADARRSCEAFASARSRAADAQSPRAPRILLIGTIPPRDDRPDSISYHLTAQNYETLLAAALSAVAEIPHDSLAIRNHPRTGVDPTLRRLLAARPGLRFRDTSRVPIAEDLAMTDIVLSFPSSGALDAVRLGKPVIQLAPADSHQVAPDEWYGFFGTAGSWPELRQLLSSVIAALPQIPGSISVPARAPSCGTESTGAGTAGGAARRIVDVIFQLRCRTDAGDHASKAGRKVEAIR